MIAPLDAAHGRKFLSNHAARDSVQTDARAGQISIGGAETPAWVEASRALAATMKTRGHDVAYVELAGATHGGMIGPTTPQALDFFATHMRGARRN